MITDRLSLSSFPFNFRRFNVAVTRGMALCVIIGQPQLLYADPHWREMIRYCVKHGTCTLFCYTYCAYISFRFTFSVRLCFLYHLCRRAAANECKVKMLQFTYFLFLFISLLTGAYSGMDISSFLKHHRATTHSEDRYTDQQEEGSESNDFLHDQEDEDLLNSVTEVANAMLVGQRSVDTVFSSVLGYEGGLGKGLGMGGQERSRGQILRGHDMEWRSIM